MLTKQIISKGLLLRNAGVLSRAAYHGGDHKHSTMNDLPIPEGDWQEQYSRRNTTFNAVLLAGVLVLGGTIAFVKSSGIIHFNFSPPKSID